MKGAGLRHVTRFKFWSPIHIYGMAEARAVKYCTSSLAKWMRNYPEKGRGWSHVTNFFMHNCGLRKISPRHAVNWDQQCRQRLISVVHTYTAIYASNAVQRLKLHQFDLLWFCCKLVRIICRQQIDQVEFEPYRAHIVRCLVITFGVHGAPQYGRFCVRQRRAVHRR